MSSSTAYAIFLKYSIKFCPLKINKEIMFQNEAVYHNANGVAKVLNLFEL